MQSGILQQRASTNIPTSAELGLSKGSSVEAHNSHASVPQPSASNSRSRDATELQLRIDELEAEKAYFVTRVRTLEQRLHEAESRCASLEETLHASHGGERVPQPTSSHTARATEMAMQAPKADTAHLQAQINELRHAVREISQRSSLPRAASMEQSLPLELRSPPAINPEQQKLREVILHQQQIIKALQGELDWTISPSPVSADLKQASKSCTLPEGREGTAARVHSTARTVMAMRSGSDSKEPAEQAHPLAASHLHLSSSGSPSRHATVEEPEPLPPQSIQTSTIHDQSTEEAEPFVMSYATLDPLAVLGNASFDPFSGKAVLSAVHQRFQSGDDAFSARSTAACSSRLSQAVQETASQLQLAFKDMDEEDALRESVVTPPPRRAVLLPQLSAFDESFGELDAPSSFQESP